MKKIRISFLFIFILLWLAYAWTFAKASPVSPQDISEVNISFDVPAGKYTVGDLIPLTLDVQYPSGWQVAIPQVAQVWRDKNAPLEVRSQSAPEQKKVGDGRMSSRVIVTIAVYTPGVTKTLPFSLILTDTNGNTHEKVVPQVSLHIDSVLQAGDDKLRDIKPQADMPVPPAWLLILAGFLCVLAFVGIFWWWQSRRVKKIRQEI